MRFIPAIAALSLALTAGAAQASPRKDMPEEELAKVLEGRVAGEPRDCLDLMDARGTQIIDKTAIVYRSGKTLWVNRPRGGAETLDTWDVLVSKPFASQLCRMDIVHLYDSSSRMPTGFISLGQFVPYRKPKTD